ncbi:MULTISPECIES: PASTA domain-containing protein [Nocardia]|uniref:PASTA domain-containing protein n=1 Tax=Nocardia abscessus TaxID=120957 RepID=UPI0018958D1F|nr:PASTA domain-containing protein [Nocardia abscessus]MBF6471363.1 PASTA domain-containing protein [Nocardia abscessus]
MRECSTCGTPNSTDAEFCVNPQCRTYLGWATSTATAVREQPSGARADTPVTAGVAPGPPRPATAPTAAPGNRQRYGVHLSLEQNQLAVDPGSAVVTTLTVHNTGTRVEEFELGVAGPMRPFAHLEPAVLSVFPDDRATAVLRFAPPRDPGIRAGQAPFLVGVRSRVNARVSDSGSGTLTVGSFSEVQAALRPETSRGRKAGKHTVTTTNAGNVPLAVQIVLTDRTGALTFQPPQAAAQLGPGAAAETSVLVGGGRKWFGRTESHAFTAQVGRPGGGAPVTLNGVRNQVPIFPWWVPVAAAVVLALTLAVVALWPGDKVPSIAGKSRADAERTLQEAGYRPVYVPKVDAGIPFGQAIGTEPRANEELERGSPVNLHVSIGPCEGECLIEVPNVLGLPLADAQKALEQAEFGVRHFEQQSPEIAKGTVIASTPAAGEQKARGSEVALAVSSGPAPTPTPAGPTPGAGPGDEKDEAGKDGTGKDGADKGKEQVPVPDVAGLPEAEAVAKIESKGLTATRVGKPDDTVAKGTVLATDPAAQTMVAKGSAVTVTVSSGPKPVAVPGLAGKPKAQALSELAALGLKTKIGGKSSTTMAAGTVLSTVPVAGAEVRPGTEVTVVVSQGRPCKTGFVFRSAAPDDPVCVDQATADRTKTENDQAKSRVSTTDRTYGPDTCVQGYVWREAVPNDHVCVATRSRADAAADNAADKDRHVE